MKWRKIWIKWLLICLMTGTGNFSLLAQSPTAADIVSSTGRTTFNYNEIPDAIMPFYPPLTGTNYFWQQSSTPIGGFTNIPGALSASYTFTAPLQQTTYFRRIMLRMIGGILIPYISNPLRIEVVSQQWENYNYVRAHAVLVSGITDWKAVDQLSIGDKLQSTTYLDGFERPLQTIHKEVAPPSQEQPNVWKDVVLFQQYDENGRESKIYKPYSTTSQPGKFKTSYLTDQTQYYATEYGETNPYNTISFDNSPLNKVTGQKKAGTAWAANPGKIVENDINEVNDNVRLFRMAQNPNDPPVSSSAYLPKTLFKTSFTDEHGKKIIEFRTNAGQLILQKVQIENTPSDAHSGWACTYSVYDDLGRVRFRFQPEAVKWLESHAWSFAGTDGQRVMEERCFQYEYDDRNYVIRKKAPGNQEEYNLYDIRGRLVFSQDGNQRIKTPSEWTATLYDELDRPKITTIYKTSKARVALQTDIDNALSGTVTVTNPVSISAVIHKNPLPASALTNQAITSPLKYFFYDDYNFQGSQTFHNGFDNLQAYATGAEFIASSSRTLDMLTGSYISVLGTTTFISSTYFMDQKGRPVQTFKSNIKNGLDIITAQYAFDGRLLSKNIKHTTTGSGYSSFSIITKNVYDKVGRLAEVLKKYGSNPFRSIAKYTADDFGRMKNKRLLPGYTGSGKNEMESLTYSYNIQSEITGINKEYALKTPGKYDKWGNFFGLYIGYDNRDNVFNTAQLNGQVTGLLWNTQGDDAQRKYDYTYDNAHRLTNAVFKERQTSGDSWVNAKMDFSVSGYDGQIKYDLNGNLLAMLQKGVLPGLSAAVVVDDLRYTYANLSNKLSKVADNTTTGTANGKLSDFLDGNNTSTDDYAYDENGNLVIDQNKNINGLAGLPGNRGIKYNYLNKPEEIKITGKGTIRITYDANGNKLQRIFVKEGTSDQTVTTYINDFVYVQDKVQYIHFGEGRLRIIQPETLDNGFDQRVVDGAMAMPDGKEGVFDFFLLDFQSNIRMILTEEIHTGRNVCTMEQNRSANEEPVFGKTDQSGNPTVDNEVKARFAVSSIPGQASGNGWTNPDIGNYVSRVGNLAGKKVGPNSLLKIMAGDKISATSLYFYKAPVVNTNNGPSLLNDLLLSLAGAITGSTGTSGLTKSAATDITSLLNGYLPFQTATRPDASNATGDKPKAYLNILFFDERFNFISEGSISTRVQQPGNGAAPLTLANIKAPKNGYAYVYVSNESDEMVYFDNIQVSHERGRIIEENHFYSFGLKIAAISSKKLPVPSEGNISNQFLFNGKELIEDADLNWYDYGFRNYDPQIARFTQLDPLADSYPYYTPYQFAGNEPIANIDLDGLEPENVTKFAAKVGGEWVLSKTTGLYSVIWNASGRAMAKTFKTTAAVTTDLVAWSTHLALIAIRGAEHAILNAEGWGLPDFFGMENDALEGYVDVEEKIAYLRGRVSGNALAIAQGLTQMTMGATLGITTSWTIVGGAIGGIISSHGAGMNAIAVFDLYMTLRQLERVKMSAEAGSDMTEDGSVPDQGSSYQAPTQSRGYDRPEIETKSGKAVKQKDAVEDWNDFLGPNQTNIDPRDGFPDPDRIWSADGLRSIRFGSHETSNPNMNKWHYHKETWYPDRVENVLQRVQP